MARPPAPLTAEAVAALPKVVLHDHLDGGLRPATIVELADEVAHELPTRDPDALGAWFVEAAGSGSLETYLATFTHTTAVMQTADNLRRVAREAVIDLSADGVVYAEQRYAPELHRGGGLSLQEVVEAVQAGLEEGVAEAATAGRTIRVGQVLATLRHGDRGQEVAEVALANRDRGVLGFDLAGPEVGFPPARHRRALWTLRSSHFPVTIHAGEADGPRSIADALHVGGALRIGHGVRLTEDITFGESTEEDPGGVDHAELGHLAHWVRDQQVPLEMCVTSNLQTGAATSVADHPITALARLGFAVTINTDNRLMSGTSMSREMQLLVDEAGWTLADLRDAALTAAWNGFIHHDERQMLVDEVILPGYTAQANGRHRA